MRILVVGVGKSGTTALLYAIKAAMPEHVRLLFEPHGPTLIQDEHMLAKVLLNPADDLGESFYHSFDRTILIVRDPRDLVISKALYRVYNVPAVAKDQARLARYLDLLRSKEQDPRSVSLCSINRLFRELIGKPPGRDEGLVALLEQAVRVSDEFLKSGLIVYTEGRGKQQTVPLWPDVQDVLREDRHQRVIRHGDD